MSSLTFKIICCFKGKKNRNVHKLWTAVPLCFFFCFFLYSPYISVCFLVCFQTQCKSKGKALVKNIVLEEASAQNLEVVAFREDIAA